LSCHSSYVIMYRAVCNSCNENSGSGLRNKTAFSVRMSYSWVKRCLI
jgi:hypothetical protein